MELPRKGMDSRDDRGHSPRSSMVILANFIRKVSAIPELPKNRPPTNREFPKKNSETTDEYYKRKTEFMRNRTSERLEADNKIIQQGITELKENPAKTYDFLANLGEYMNKKISGGTAIIYYSKIKQYLRKNGITIERHIERDHVKLAKANKYKKTPVTKEHLKILLDSCDEAHKGLYLLMVSSGIRVFEGISLTKERIELDREPCRITVKPYYNKTYQERETYCSKEAVDILSRLMEGRTSKQYVFVNNLSEVIVKNKDGKEDLDPKVRIALEKAEHAQEVYFIRLRKKCNLGEKRLGSHNSLTLHKFRRFFYTQSTRVDPDFGAYLAGWEENMKNVYYTPENTDELYQKIEPYVSVYSTIPETQQKMAKQIKEQAYAIEQLMELAEDAVKSYNELSEKMRNAFDPDTLRQDLLSKLRSRGITREQEAYLTSLKGWKSLKK